MGRGVRGGVRWVLEEEPQKSPGECAMGRLARCGRAFTKEGRRSTGGTWKHVSLPEHYHEVLDQRLRLVHAPLVL